MRVAVSHPCHSGMQMAQIILLNLVYLPARHVEKIKTDLDGVGNVDITGSISPCESPGLNLKAPGDIRSDDGRSPTQTAPRPRPKGT